MRALDAPRGLCSSLLELLRAHGHADVAAEVVEEQAKGSSFGKLFDWLNDNRNADRYPHFLRLVADAEPGELTTRQRVQLGELGDFLETLDMNDMGVTSLFRQSDDFLRELIDLACVLFGFDRGVLAAEAQTVLDRLEKDDSLETFFSLFDTAEPRSETDWSSVDDPDVAVDLLASLPTSPEPRIWSDSANPVLRRIAARSSVAVRSGRITKQLEAFLADEHGYVREAALEKLAATDLPELESLLEKLSSQERPGWRCLHCCTVNPPGMRSCQKDDCHNVGPDPAAKAKELLDQLRQDRGGQG